MEIVSAENKSVQRCRDQHQFDTIIHKFILFYTQALIMKKPPPKYALQFKITLHDIEPKIWRRIVVPDNYTFWDLHVALQDAMGWLDYHLHEFLLPSHGATIKIGIPDDSFEYDEGLLAGWEIDIVEYFNAKGDAAEYVYDYGDHWRHHLILEDILPMSTSASYPQCIGGERACPPEDCGGWPGYEDFLEILADKKHEEYEMTVGWLKGHAKNYWPYLPDEFDSSEVDFHDPQKRWEMAFTQED